VRFAEQFLPTRQRRHRHWPHLGGWPEIRIGFTDRRIQLPDQSLGSLRKRLASLEGRPKLRVGWPGHLGQEILLREVAWESSCCIKLR